jgi:uncharacterized protein YabE (DUF348 family)
VRQESHATPLAGGLVVLAVLVMLAGLAAGYEAGLTSVTLVVDGQPRQIRTHQETVGALLVDAGIELRQEDRVTPAPDAALAPGTAVIVARARLAVIAADGRQREIRTHATRFDEILREANVALGPYDRVTAEERTTADGDTALELDVQRAVAITLHEDGQTVTLHTTAPTVGKALRDAGLTLYMADRLEPGQGQPVSVGMHIYVERSRPVTVRVDERTIRTRTHRNTVGEVLADLGIVLTGQDYTTPPPDQPLEAQTSIEVVRVEERFVIEQEPIPFEIVWQPDPELEIDNQRLIQEGAPGVLERRVRVRYENGHLIARTLDSEYVAVHPTTKIFGYGTQIVVRELDTPQGPVEYWRVIHMLATSYSASTAGTPRSAPWYGRTAGGCVMDDDIVAVSYLVPWKSYVYVPDYGVGYACDRGGAIRGRRIDLGYADENLVLWYRWVDVYLLTPVPPADEIEYIIGQ